MKLPSLNLGRKNNIKVLPLIGVGLAEFIGTAILAFAVLSTNEFAPGLAPFSAGVTLLFLMYVLGPISGSQVNPGVTVGLVAARKYPLVGGVVNVLAQILGAFYAVSLVELLAAKKVTVPVVASSTALAETVGLFILALAMTAIVTRVVSDDARGLTAGAALFVAVLVSLAFSGGLVNPAIAIASGANLGAYVLWPLVGGVLGSVIFSFLWAVNNKLAR